MAKCKQLTSLPFKWLTRISLFGVLVVTFTMLRHLINCRIIIIIIITGVSFLCIFISFCLFDC